MQNTISEKEIESYKRDGFILKRGALLDSSFTALEGRFLKLAEEKTGESFSAMDDLLLVSRISSDRDLEMYLYDEIRKHPELSELSQSSELAQSVSSLLGDEDTVLLEKIPFRIDCPNVIRELAIWHQDQFYVKGSEHTITAWIPLLDTTYRDGCLLVMPRSHSEGLIPHNVNALGKKWYPSDIFDREVRYVEMKRGDVLFFHSCLLHSSGNNIGDRIRFSIQARYLPENCESDPGMGKRIRVL